LPFILDKWVNKALRDGYLDARFKAESLNVRSSDKFIL
jgi:hypothetical protein